MNNIISKIDCRGEVDSLGAESFFIEMDDEYGVYFWVNKGLYSVDLVISGRYKADILDTLLYYWLI